MPAIIDPTDVEIWLGDDAAAALMTPAPNDVLWAWAVCRPAGVAFGPRAVNDVRRDGAAATVAALAAWLTAQPCAGLVLARETDVPGTIALAALGARHARSPDLAVTFVGSDEPDPRGVPGVGLIDVGDVPVGGGMHGGLHRHELATVLALGGGAVLQCPADLTDVAPTMLALLGVGANGMDGTPLAAAWDGADAAPRRETLAGAPGDGPRSRCSGSAPRCVPTRWSRRSDASRSADRCASTMAAASSWISTCGDQVYLERGTPTASA
jgi:hypothetical protein